MSLKIRKIPTKKHNIPLRGSMKNGTIPPYPCSLILSGRSGSGKTNLLINLLDPDSNLLYGNYYHYILVFSPTASNLDDLYESLKIPPENFKATYNKNDLQEIIDTRKAMINELGLEEVGKKHRMLIIMDDIIASRSFLQSEEALQMFVLLRHYYISVIVNTQSMTKIPRALRVNSNALFIFLSNLNEKEILKDELTPPNMTKKEFAKVIDYATNEPYSFIYINNKEMDQNKRFRKNLDEIIDLDKFKTNK